MGDFPRLRERDLGVPSPGALRDSTKHRPVLCPVCGDLSEFLHMERCRQQVLSTARLNHPETFPFQQRGVFLLPALIHQLGKALTPFRSLLDTCGVSSKE